MFIFPIKIIMDDFATCCYSHCVVASIVMPLKMMTDTVLHKDSRQKKNECL